MTGKRTLTAAFLGATLAGLTLTAWFLRPTETSPAAVAQTDQQVLPKLTPEQAMGKVNKELFPDLTNPAFVAGAEATFLNDDDDVLLVRGKDATLAFPVVLMGWHHIVNAELDGEPFALTFCILADTAVTFSRRMSEKVLSLGVLGNLYYGDMIMYDRETNSQYLQITGDAFAGPHQGQRLRTFGPTLRVPWRHAKSIANLKVLPPQRELDYYRVFFDKNKDAAHGIRTVEGRGLTLDPRTVPLTRGMGVALNTESAFFPLTEIERAGIMNESVGGIPIVLAFEAASGKHVAWERQVGEKVLTLQLGDREIVDAETNSRWDWEGTATAGPLKGEHLKSVTNAFRIFWYNWAAFFPATRLAATP